MRKKIRFYKELLIELIETLCSICLYIETDSIINRTYNRYGYTMLSHFRQLKNYSETLRNEEKDKKKRRSIYGKQSTNKSRGKIQ